MLVILITNCPNRDIIDGNFVLTNQVEKQVKRAAETRQLDRRPHGHEINEIGIHFHVGKYSPSGGRLPVAVSVRTQRSCRAAAYGAVVHIASPT
jgi:hypothetical protein